MNSAVYYLQCARRIEARREEVLRGIAVDPVPLPDFNPVGRHHGDKAEEEEPGNGPHAGDRRLKDVAEDEEAEKAKGGDAKGPGESSTVPFRILICVLAF